MKHSEQINELMLALAQAQGEMANAIKDTMGQVGQQKRLYADLASVREACQGPLSKNKLAVTQLPCASGNVVTVTTVLGHASGQWISGELTLQAINASPQSVGSAITYARRYALLAIVGLAPDDDDGQAAQGKVDPHRESKPSTKPATPSPQAAPAPAPAKAQTNGHAVVGANGQVLPAPPAGPRPGREAPPQTVIEKLTGWAKKLEKNGLILCAADAIGWIQLRLDAAQLDTLTEADSPRLRAACVEFEAKAKAGDVSPFPKDWERANNLLKIHDLDWPVAFAALQWPEDADPDSLNRAQLRAVIRYLESLETVEE